MRTAGSILRPCALAIMLLGISAPAGLLPSAVHASEIKYIVNNVPVTSYDIQRRVALLRIQNTRGNVQQVAAEQLIDQAVRAAEMARMNIRISDDQVSDAYERFARSNNMSIAQMDNVMNQSGVTKAHFREFIRSQMGWSQVMNARNRSAGGGSGGRMSEQEVVQRMLQQGGEKPSATEYMLQQVIFVVPAAERGAKMASRKREAEAMRQRFRSCESTREFARGLVDVTVRELGRVLAPELPPDWADRVKATNAGAATTVRETERGVEFIGVCSAREVSDDRVAQMVMQSEDSAEGNEASEKLTKELREKAQIIRR